MAAIVVQLGLAMMPSSAAATSPGFTSETTSGTRSSIRQADELSTTVAPASATRGAHSFEVEPPAENRATSRPAKSAVSMSSTTTSPAPQGSALPADLAEAK